MQTKPFTEFIKEINGGALVGDLSHAVQDLVGDIENIGSGGEITVKLKFSPKTYGEGQKVMEVTGDYSVKKPKRARRASPFFVTPENNLIKEDPRQANMFSSTRSLGGGSTIDASTGEILKNLEHA